MAKPLTVHCPDCSAILEVDAATGDVLHHRAPAKASRSVDLDNASELLRRQERERDDRFRQSVNAEKNRDELLAKKFDHGLKRVRDNPNEPRPVRDVDLD